MNRTAPFEPDAATGFYRALEPLCVAGLRRALDTESGTYRQQLRSGRWDVTRGTEDLTSTAICLIAIARAKIDPVILGLDPSRSLEALTAMQVRHRYDGALGLLVWANAVWGGEPVGRWMEKLGRRIGQIPELVSRLTTMEIAWLTSGLAHEWRRSNESMTRRALSTAVQELTRRHQSSGIFCHATERAPIQSRARRWVANFADQIYAIQALSLAALATGDNEGLEEAQGCAARLVELQGPQGQWWWHYNARSGNVAEQYPVYSVHQHGMAPMALVALAETGAAAYEPQVARGRAWLGQNELGLSMIDYEAGTIWRDVRCDERLPKRWVRRARSVLGSDRAVSERRAERLTVNFETRPYEWGWCLYAGAVEARGNKGTARSNTATIL